MNKDSFKEYFKESELDKREKVYSWNTAIDLQIVDGLKRSDYLIHTTVRNIEDEISFEEVDTPIHSYYEENQTMNSSNRNEEVDKVSARIAALLSENAFSFIANEYLSIHRNYFLVSSHMHGVLGLQHNKEIIRA